MEQPQQQQGCKYYCKICKKGFACGRALGGHMRAHGINDDVASTDEDAEPPQTSYALRSNPNRLKTCRACENCGKDFSSWKSFLEHGRCGGTSGSGHVDGEADGSTMLSLSRSDGVAVDTGGCTGWSKGKRSRRAVVADGPLSEEDDLAASCLVMLSAARVDPVAGTETEESCASASREEEEDSKKYLPEGITMNAEFAFEVPKPKQLPSSSKGVFECKACKRVFTSHQALGGHRASHKKVKGCFAAKLDVDNDDHPLEEEPITTSDTEKMALVPFDNAPMVVTPLRKKGKLHECTICHRVFTSGQALGGHKRCHWLTGNTASTSGVATIAKIHQTHDVVQHQQLLQLGPILEMKTGPSLDLNLPVSTVAMATATADDTLTLEMSAALCLQNYMNKNDYNSNNIINTNIDSIKSDNIKSKNNGCSSSCDRQDDEGERKKSKVAKLSELKDVSMGGENSQWLQVGIGSCTNESNAET